MTVEMLLYAKILKQAIDDWKSNPQMRNGIRKFLNSDWGESVCCEIGTDASYVLAKLENGEV